jgi:hypothetical protein
MFNGGYTLARGEKIHTQRAAEWSTMIRDVGLRRARARGARMKTPGLLLTPLDFRERIANPLFFGGWGG